MRAFQRVPGRDHVESLRQLSSRAVNPVQHDCPLPFPPLAETSSYATPRREDQHSGKCEKTPHSCQKNKGAGVDENAEQILNLYLSLARHHDGKEQERPSDTSPDRAEDDGDGWHKPG